jgi:NAD(P)-dependent dehydrogenase (short-subunit alcohol dehydrogenase family)
MIPISHLLQRKSFSAERKRRLTTKDLGSSMPPAHVLDSEGAGCISRRRCYGIGSQVNRMNLNEGDQPMTHSQLPSALITGGGTGIGRETAIRLASTGHTVAVVGRRSAPLDETCDIIGQNGGTAVACPADITDEIAVASAVAQAREALGPFGVLVNNAGSGKSAPFHKMTLDLFDEMININLRAAVVVTQAVLPDMLEAGFGRIVNVASVAGLKGYIYITAYCAAKHGLVGLTRSLAQEVATKGITVNAVCPGYVDTELTQQTLTNISEKVGSSIETARKRIEQTSPQQRLFSPSEVAATIHYLTTQDAAGINGQTIAICGGEIAG